MPAPPKRRTGVSGMTLHEALDRLVAAFLLANRTKLPSTTTILELIEWSAAQPAAAAEEAKCAKCGKFLSLARQAMRIPRCGRCD